MKSLQDCRRIGCYPIEALSLPFVFGLPEWIDSPQDGILAKSGDAKALADATPELAVSAELRRKIGNAAVSRIGHKYNSPRFAKQLSELISW